MHVIAADARPSTPADPARYSGEVWTDALIEGGPPGHVNVARVAFSPGGDPPLVSDTRLLRRTGGASIGRPTRSHVGAEDGRRR